MTRVHDFFFIHPSGDQSKACWMDREKGGFEKVRRHRIPKRDFCVCVGFRSGVFFLAKEEK